MTQVNVPMTQKGMLMTELVVLLTGVFIINGEFSHLYKALTFFLSYFIH